MTTDPGDLVLDITCGSGTTAYVAEQWGRRWITCDTSRVAIAIARQRLLTAKFDFYTLADPSKGINAGFVYKTVPHVTLKSIANNEPPATETLYDSPEIDSKKTRVTGPFTIEALPVPVVFSVDEALNAESDDGAKLSDWREQLQATGIITRNGERIRFSRIESLSVTRWLNAKAYTDEENSRLALVCFAGESTLLDSKRIAFALEEATKQIPKPDFMIFAAFQTDPEAQELLNSCNWEGVAILQVQMNPDLMTSDLKRKIKTDQSFWLVGQPDIELERLAENKYRVKVFGFDYYNVKDGGIDSGNTDRIAMRLLDTDYDGMTLNPSQVFFPMEGKSGGWKKLSDSLRAEIDETLIEAYRGNISLPFEIEDGKKIAVKIIDDRGIESMKVITVTEGE